MHFRFQEIIHLSHFAVVAMFPEKCRENKGAYRIIKHCFCRKYFVQLFQNDKALIRQVAYKKKSAERKPAQQRPGTEATRGCLAEAVRARRGSGWCTGLTEPCIYSFHASSRNTTTTTTTGCPKGNWIFFEMPLKVKHLSVFFIQV